jgi:membrane fusion protein (multidrug efflux system)
VRYEPLVAKNAISREEYETAVSLEKAASAAVEAGRAMVERAEIDLSYTKVMAPEAGLVGKTEVYAGTLVGRGQSTLLTRISRIDPIHVRFTFSEKDYLGFARRKAGRGQAHAKPGGNAPSPTTDAQVPMELLLADGTVHPGTGEMVFVDRTVDPRTGTILAEAAFANPDHIVRPGQYARVRAQIEVKPAAILVPQAAVQELQGVYSVMVVSAESKVEQRLVQPGPRVGPLWVIDSGLKGGEQIVVEGLQKIRPGVQVEVEQVAIEEQEEKQEASEPAPEGAAGAASDGR